MSRAVNMTHSHVRHILDLKTRVTRAVCCNTLQHTATHCNTLQHTTTYCNTLHTKSPTTRICLTSHYLDLKKKFASETCVTWLALHTQCSRHHSPFALKYSFDEFSSTHNFPLTPTISLNIADSHLIFPWQLLCWWKGVERREVGGWGRDPKKCTGRDWGMGSSTI